MPVCLSVSLAPNRTVDGSIVNSAWDTPRMLHSDRLLSRTGATEITPEGWQDLCPILTFLEAKTISVTVLDDIICIWYVLKLHLMHFCTEGREIWPIIRPFDRSVLCTPLINGFCRCWLAVVKSRLASLTTQSVNATGAHRKQRSLLNLQSANCWSLRSSDSDSDSDSLYLAHWPFKINMYRCIHK